MNLDKIVLIITDGIYYLDHDFQLDPIFGTDKSLEKFEISISCA